MTVIGAQPERLDLDVYQGDDLAFVFDVSGAGLNLTGAAGSAQIRRYLGGSAVVAFQVSVDDVLSRISLLLPAADAARLAAGPGVWDLQIVDAGGSIRTLVAGSVNVVAEVTVP